MSRRAELWVTGVTATAVWAFLLYLAFIEVGNIRGPEGSEHSPVLPIAILMPLAIGLTWAWWRARSRDRAGAGGAA